MTARDHQHPARRRVIVITTVVAAGALLAGGTWLAGASGGTKHKQSDADSLAPTARAASPSASASASSGPVTATKTDGCTYTPDAPSASNPDFPALPPGVDAALKTEPTITIPAGASPTELVIKDLIEGTGEEVESDSQVSVNYVGVLYRSCERFDSSWMREAEASFSVEGVIKGWADGLQGMKVGGRRELVIPPALAYGADGSGTIGPNETLVFVVDLVELYEPQR